MSAVLSTLPTIGQRNVQAAVTEAAGAPFVLRDLLISEPRIDEVRVRIVACGVCHTDVAMQESSTRAPKPIVLGHEGAGVVEAVGSGVEGFELGDHVVLSYSWCGHCANCADGHPAYCRHMNALNFQGARLDGSGALHTVGGQRIRSHFFGQSSFSTSVITEVRNLVKVPRHLPLEVMAPLGCGIQTGAGAMLNSLKVRRGSAVAVFGVGSVGLAAVMAARLAGARIIVAVDVQPARLALALELGATAAANGSEGDLLQQLSQVLPNGADHALDTTGREDTLQAAIATLATGGVCGLVGIASRPLAVDTRLLMVGGRSLRGIVEGDSQPQTFIPELIAHYEAGRLPIDRLISTYPFTQINDAVADMKAGRVIKPVLMMS